MLAVTSVVVDSCSAGVVKASRNGIGTSSREVVEGVPRIYGVPKVLNLSSMYQWMRQGGRHRKYVADKCKTPRRRDIAYTGKPSHTKACVVHKYHMLDVLYRV